MLFAQWVYPLKIYTNKYLGIALLALALAITWWTKRQYDDFQTTHIPFCTPTKLITQGMNRYTRNPFYLALILSMAGFGNIIQSTWSWFAFVILWFLLDKLVVKKEERVLKECFGSAYDEYCQNVRRWI